MFIPKKDIRRDIALHCKSCIYDPTQEGSWVKQVQECTITACNLHRHRPTQKGYKETNLPPNIPEGDDV